MSMKMWHGVILLIVGIAIGYWVPSIGDMTLGKIYKAS